MAIRKSCNSRMRATFTSFVGGACAGVLMEAKAMMRMDTPTSPRDLFMDTSAERLLDTAYHTMSDLRQLRAYAISQSLFSPTTLKAAIHRLGFIQADPIRSPA